MKIVRNLIIAAGCLALVTGETRAETPPGASSAVERKAETASKEAEPPSKPKPEGSASAGKPVAPGKRPTAVKPPGLHPKAPSVASPAKPVKPVVTGVGSTSKPSNSVNGATVGTAGQITKIPPSSPPAAKPAAVRDLTPASVDAQRHRGASPPVLGGAAASTVRSTAALNGTGMRNRNALK